MATKAEIEQLLPEGYKVRLRRVPQSDWRRPTWRAEFLASYVPLELYHVHDEPGTDDDRVVFFATPTS